MRKKIRLLVVLAMVALPAFSQDDNLFSQEKIEAYAGFLFNTNQYGFAAEEYERLVFLDRSNEQYQAKMLKSYRFAGEYDQGMRAFESLNDPREITGTDLLKEYSKISLLSGNPGNIRLMLDDYPMDEGFKNNLDLTMRLISYPEYSLNLDGLQQDLLNKDLLDLYNEAFNLRHKNRFLAASLSAVVPGLGKVYAGKWKDAIFSVLFISGTGYQAYRAFKEHGIESVYGWIMGSLSFGFYIGNIYGSAKAARLYTLNQNLDYREKVVDYYIHQY
ncbi:MAG: hypothetical protein JW801_01275 [Bacteroidales bacterium]|nr:hypothetical protein [Bacteroidales bacterium]